MNGKLKKNKKAEVEGLACSRLRQTTLITVAEGCVRVRSKLTLSELNVIFTFASGNR